MNKAEIKRTFLAQMQNLAQDLVANKITQKDYQTEVSKIVSWADKAFAEIQIIPIQMSGSYRTGTLSKYTKKEIIDILGFEPNIADDEEKVVNSWAFMVDGFECAIWDYKGSHHYHIWSTYDPHNVLGNLFKLEKFPC